MTETGPEESRNDRSTGRHRPPGDVLAGQGPDLGRPVGRPVAPEEATQPSADASDWAEQWDRWRRQAQHELEHSEHERAQDRAYSAHPVLRYWPRPWLQDHLGIGLDEDDAVLVRHMQIRHGSCRRLIGLAVEVPAGPPAVLYVKKFTIRQWEERLAPTEAALGISEASSANLTAGVGVMRALGRDSSSWEPSWCERCGFAAWPRDLRPAWDRRARALLLDDLPAPLDGR